VPHGRRWYSMTQDTLRSTIDLELVLDHPGEAASG
jgi:hypothetical protein